MTATLCGAKCVDLFTGAETDCHASFGSDPLVDALDDNTSDYNQCDGGPCAAWVPPSECASGTPVFAEGRLLVQCGDGVLFADQTDAGRPATYFGRRYETVHVTVSQ